ncbi:MAG: hypothetical protein RL414_1266 [Actinomycetota bacterium]
MSRDREQIQGLVIRCLIATLGSILLTLLASILTPNLLQSASAGCVPTNQFTLTASGETVTLTMSANPWTACMNRPGSTSVYYSTSATGPWTNQVGATVGVYPYNMTWVKTGLTPGVTYYFAVDAKDRVGNAGANAAYFTWPTNPREPAVKSITVPSVSASITYAHGGGSGSAPTTPTTTNTGSTFVTPANTYTRTGYSFAGWFDGTNKYAEGATYPATGRVTGNVTLTAQWLALTSYSISYAAGSGEGSAPTTPTSVTSGSTFTTPANTFSRTGYSFAGWSDGTNTYAAGATYPVSGSVSGNVTLTATWLADTKSISYVAGGGTGSAPTTPTTVSYASIFTTPANTFTRAGYSFVGWSDGTDRYAAGVRYPTTGSITRNVTLTAAWVANVASTALATDSWAWNDQADVGNHNWHALASSSDGSRLYAASESCGLSACSGGVVDAGGIWASSDYGVTWTAIGSTDGRKWFSMATNSNGTKVVAVDRGGDIWTSVDSGATWTARRVGGAVHNWESVASSSDGDNLVAVASDGFIFTSTDSGATWTNYTPSGVTGFTGVSSSNDGSRLAATTWSSGIYTSSNYGQTWTRRTLTVPNPSDTTLLQMVSMSGDGSRLVTGSRPYSSNGGITFTSSDYGVTWTSSAQTSYDYIGFASSGDGSRVAAAIYGQTGVSTSSDYGVTWNYQPTGSRGVIPIATNIDGSLLFVGGYGGHLWTGSIPRARVVAVVASATSAIVPAATNTPAAALAFTETTNTSAVRITPMDNPTSADSTPFDLTSASIFDIAVVNITGPVEICVDGGPSVRLWHFTNGAWVDVTTRQTENQTCGLTTSFSPFATAALRINQSQADAAVRAISEEAAKAAAEAAAAKREAEKKAARADITSNLKNSKDLSVETFATAEIAGINATNIASVQAELLALPEESRADINQVLKVARKYEIVGSIGSDRINYLQSNTFVEIGLIPAASKNKVALVAAVKKLPESARDTYAEIKAAIDAETIRIKSRSDRLAAIISRNASRSLK